jgi:hypothetical protein
MAPNPELPCALAAVGACLIGLGSFIVIAAPGDGQTGMTAFPLWMFGGALGLSSLFAMRSQDLPSGARGAIIFCAVAAIVSVILSFVVCATYKPMTSKAATVDQYLAELPDNRRPAIQALRETVLANLPVGLEEGMQYGMIGYYVPHSIYPKGYHCDKKQPVPFAHIASQKNHMALYLFCLYGDEAVRERFQDRFKAAGGKLDPGKSCVRFKKIEDLPLDVIAQTLKEMEVASFLERYEKGIA